MITLRLDDNLEQAVNYTAKNMGISKSQLIRESIAEYLKNHAKNTPWEAGKDLFGSYSSGQSNLSSDRKQILKQKIAAKRK